MTDGLRSAYRIWAALVFLGVIVQIGAAGYGAFNADHKADKTNALTHKAFDHGFNFHTGFGYVLFLAGILLFLFALGARLGKPGILRALGVPVLVLVAIVLAQGGGDHPIVGIFHPIAAFLVAGLTGFLAHDAWSGTRRAAAGRG